MSKPGKRNGLFVRTPRHILEGDNAEDYAGSRLVNEGGLDGVPPELADVPLGEVVPMSDEHRALLADPPVLKTPVPLNPLQRAMIDELVGDDGGE